METAFAPFEQIDSQLNRQYEGTGLGLPLSLGFMRLLGGDLILDSIPDKGTKAIARLPGTCVIKR
jgi:signal transduction histidine kinase